jgi:hypothetical protein
VQSRRLIKSLFFFFPFLPHYTLNITWFPLAGDSQERMISHDRSSPCIFYIMYHYYICCVISKFDHHCPIYSTCIYVYRVCPNQCVIQSNEIPSIGAMSPKQPRFGELPYQTLHDCLQGCVRLLHISDYHHVTTIKLHRAFYSTNIFPQPYFHWLKHSYLATSPDNSLFSVQCLDPLLIQ